MMMHRSDHDYNTGETSEVKTIAKSETTSDSLQVTAPETQKPHHEESPRKKNILDMGGIGMVILMTVMMAVKFIF